MWGDRDEAGRGKDRRVSTLDYSTHRGKAILVSYSRPREEAY